MLLLFLPMIVLPMLAFMSINQSSESLGTPLICLSMQNKIEMEQCFMKMADDKGDADLCNEVPTGDR